MLEVEAISKTFVGPAGEVRALRDVSLRVDAGQLVAARGPSGCGKSTLLLACGALLRPDAGTVRVNGQDPYALGGEARTRLRAHCIGFVFQRFHLVPYLNVRDNVLLAGLGVKRAKKHGLELLEQLGMSQRLAHYPAQLSTGERQRTALARALFNRPALLLADEPTGNLDAHNAKIVLETLKAFAEDGGAVLLVTHDCNVAATASQVIEMAQGAVVETPLQIGG